MEKDIGNIIPSKTVDNPKELKSSESH